MATALAFVLLAPSGRDATADHPQVTLVYIGADDCAPCRVWQRTQRPGLEAQFPRISYREIKSASLLDVLKDASWPEDLRPYRAKLAKGAGVPAWIVVQNGEIVAQNWGLSRWDHAVVPQLRSIIR